VLRAILLYLSSAPWARRLVSGWGISRRVASRFVAGDTLEEAVAAIQALNEAGMNATLDHLGENVNTPEDAERAAEDYLSLLDEIQGADLRANVSLKLTQLGLMLDFDLCVRNLRRIVDRAQSFGNFVRIDMEQSAILEDTLRVYHELRQTGATNLGVVIQSYLYRSDDDVQKLADAGTPVRLVKGAYDEPANVAYPKKKDVDYSFDRESEMLIQGTLAHGAVPISADGRIPPIPAVGTHDHLRIDHARNVAAKAGLAKTGLEFQLLYGIRTELARTLVNDGYPVRIYVPYGTEWYPYFMRRLAERPANLWFFVSNFFRG
jgi:proline dehydrogenase